MMAGWSRAKHPELIHASVASSAPVLAQLDMPEYYNRVAKAYSVDDNDVGGSQACEDAIRTGHQKIGSMFETQAGQAALEEIFHFPKGALMGKSSQHSFAAQGVASFPAQSNDPKCTRPACNIKGICKIMVDKSKGDEVRRLAHVREAQGYGVLGSNYLWPAFWTYQTCAEFGFYQTCEKGSDCFFTQGLLTLDEYTRTCAEFGISRSQIENNIEATNKHYGGRRPTGTDDTTLATCIMWSNGEVDPWAGLGVLQAPNAEQPVLMIGGASHHAWTHPSERGDQPSVVSGRLAERKQVETFLASACSEGSTSMVYSMRSLVDDEGSELRAIDDVTASDCERECEATSACHSFSFSSSQKRCHLKDGCVTATDRPRMNGDYVTYYKPCSSAKIVLI